MTNQESCIQIAMMASRQDSNAEVTFTEVTSAKPPLRTQPDDVNPHIRSIAP
jgi:hypothetical protein